MRWKTFFRVIAIYMVVSGFIITLLWPEESAIYINPVLVLLGDTIYDKAINVIGDPTSPYAHYTIPWLLRIPQVYSLTGIIVSLFIFLIARKL